ncbi:transglutaminaseTgpA domain-containing protein [Nocardioides sp. NPDC023903]|uniref:transglutaminaseTgpA domain-containing protein n=1 Tax=Nocardioides sp. NPDC023903 TaxID=3157195 RepID=UPI0033CEA8B1
MRRTPQTGEIQPQPGIHVIDHNPEAAAPSVGRLVFTGFLLIALWALVLDDLTDVLTPNAWLSRALTICTATITVGCLLRVLTRTQVRRKRIAVTIPVGGGAAAGLACWLWWTTRSGELGGWLRDPAAKFTELVDFTIRQMPPFAPGEPFSHVLLFAVVVTVTLSAALLIGADHPLAAGVIPALLLLVPVAVNGTSVSGLSLLGVGLILALLAWAASPHPQWTGVLSAGVAVVVAATAVALMPPVQDRVWNSSLLRSPVSDAVPDVTVTLARDLRDRSQTRAFSYTSDVPGAHRFTLATLADFDGGEWQPREDLDENELTVADPRSTTSVTPAPTPSAAGASGVPNRSVTIEIDGLLSSWLPLPQSTVQVAEVQPDPGQGNDSALDLEQWRWSSQASTARTEDALTRRGDRYTALATSLLVDNLSRDDVPASSTQLFSGPGDAPDELDPYLELPAELPPTLAETAQRVGARTDDRLDVAYALQDWFQSGEFAYDLDAPYQPGADLREPYAVIEALLTERRGFCVHYASAFAVLARELGVPTRLAVGYASYASTDNETDVLGRDLHAWPEIYIDDVGWVAFEPTPGRGGSRSAPVGASAGAVQDQPVPPEPIAEDTPSSAETTPTPQETTPGEGTDRSTPDASGDAGDEGGPGTDLQRGAAWTVPVLLILLLPAAVRLLRRRRRRYAMARGNAPAQNAWAELVDTATDLGLFAPAADTPAPRAMSAEALAEYLHARVSMTTEPAAASHRLAEAASAERYGGATHSAPDTQIRPLFECAAAWLVQRSTRPVRIRATLLPRSLWRDRGAKMPYVRMPMDGGLK